MRGYPHLVVALDLLDDLTFRHAGVHAVLRPLPVRLRDEPDADADLLAHVGCAAMRATNAVRAILHAEGDLLDSAADAIVTFEDVDRHYAASSGVARRTTSLLS